mmetsp:Transcript_35040/g.73937  ORF Transcript_35040/g.73937 Transcript_35040/m.73937 type:complete len:228 (-) Transcript_35040:582-1265(-)
MTSSRTCITIGSLDTCILGNIMQIIATRIHIGTKSHPSSTSNPSAIGPARHGTVPHALLMDPIDVILVRTLEVFHDATLLGHFGTGVDVEMVELCRAAFRGIGIVRRGRVDGYIAGRGGIRGIGTVLGASVAVFVLEPLTCAHTGASCLAVCRIHVGRHCGIVATTTIFDGIIEFEQPSVHTQACLSLRAGRRGILDTKATTGRIIFTSTFRRTVRPIHTEIQTHIT